MDDDEKKGRAEGEPGEDAEGEETPEDAGMEPSAVCGSCGMGNEKDAKFCDQCGTSMAALPLDNDAPPSSKKPGATSVTAPKRVSAEATVAGILGATSESIPAVKSRAIDLRHVFDTSAAVFATTNPGEIVGHLLGLPERLAAGDKAIKDHAKAKADSEAQERWGLAKRLNALGLAGRPRSTIFVDKVGNDGKRAAVGLQPEYARMELDVFRGLVSSLEKSAPKARRNPFEASKERAEESARATAQTMKGGPSMSGEITAADIVWAKAQPVFTRLADKRPVADHDKIARQVVLTARGLGGVQ